LLNESHFRSTLWSKLNAHDADYKSNAVVALGTVKRSLTLPPIPESANTQNSLKVSTAPSFWKQFGGGMPELSSFFPPGRFPLLGFINSMLWRAFRHNINGSLEARPSVGF
jgi:hypothetical protein